MRFTFLEKDPEGKGSSYYPNGLKFSIADLTGASRLAKKSMTIIIWLIKNIKLEDFCFSGFCDPLCPPLSAGLKTL